VKDALTRVHLTHVLALHNRSHWILSHTWAVFRDLDRLKDLKKRISIMPLGSGALAGHPFNVDRAFLAKELGFAMPVTHSAFTGIHIMNA
jgi:argininosuccinate lyase